MCTFVLASLPPESTPGAATALTAGLAPVEPAISVGAVAEPVDSAAFPVWMFMDKVQRRAYVDEKVRISYTHLHLELTHPPLDA
jgi:hypothetical protein